MTIRGLDELLESGVQGRRILLRADLNVPLDDGHITDDGRVRAVLPTLLGLREAGAAVVVCSHLGRPKGQPDPQFSLAPVARRLSELSGGQVQFATDSVGDAAGSITAGLGAGEVALLENLRFHPGETSKDDAQRAEFAEQLVVNIDAYVDEAFGAMHRKHASVYEVATLRPSFAGWLVRRELEVLGRLTGAPARPYLVALGGAKVSDKLAVIDALLPNVDRLLVGGGMCFTFLAAQGYEVGGSLLELEMIETCQDLLRRAGDRIVLPSDVVAATALAVDAEHATVPVEQIPPGWMGLDIGPATVAGFADAIADAHTIFWNGPMGVFELPPFSYGTLGVAEAISANAGLTVVGGGDSAAAVRILGLAEDSFDHISTGGGASLAYLEGEQLPGLTVLEAP